MLPVSIFSLSSVTGGIFARAVRFPAGEKQNTAKKSNKKKWVQRPLHTDNTKFRPAGLPRHRRAEVNRPKLCQGDRVCQQKRSAPRAQPIWSHADSTAQTLIQAFCHDRDSMPKILLLQVIIQYKQAFAATRQAFPPGLLRLQNSICGRIMKKAIRLHLYNKSARLVPFL